MPFWIVKSENVSNMDGEHVSITSSQPRTNMSHEGVDSGWMGTTNNIHRYAHGRFDTMAEARVALQKLTRDFKMLVQHDSPFGFDGFIPTDTRRRGMLRPSELWNADGTATYIALAWREHHPAEGDPKGEPYIEYWPETEDKHVEWLNITRHENTDPKAINTWNHAHTFAWEFDDKKAVVVQTKDDALKSPDGASVVDVYSHVQSVGVPTW